MQLFGNDTTKNQGIQHGILMIAYQNYRTIIGKILNPVHVETIKKQLLPIGYPWM
jgi:hypothetical protein